MLSFRQRFTLAMVPVRMRLRNLSLRLLRAYDNWADEWVTNALIKLDPEAHDDKLRFILAEDLFDLFEDDDEL